METAGSIETYAEILQKFRLRRNEDEVLFPLMSQLKNQLGLQSAKTCLSVGTGTGHYDLEFVKRSLPNLKTFIAVERNEDCAAILKANIETTFPHLQTLIYPESVEGWKGPESKVDVILLMHFFYDMVKEERLKLVEKCFSSWLEPSTGLIVIVNMSDEDPKVNSMQMMYRELEGWNLLPEADEIKEEIRTLGLDIPASYKYQCSFDLRNLDPRALQTFHAYETKQKFEADIDKLVHKIAPSGIGSYVGEIFVVKSI